MLRSSESIGSDSGELPPAGFLPWEVFFFGISNCSTVEVDRNSFKDEHALAADTALVKAEIKHLNDMLDGHYQEIGVILTSLKMLTESSESPLWVGHPVGWSMHKSRFSKQSARPDYGSAQRSALDLVFLGVKEPTPIRTRDVDCSSRTSSACRAR